MSNWRYDFDCKDCQQQARIGDAFYCLPIRSGRKCISADDDYVVRCSEYEPRQRTLFDMMEETENANDT